MKGSSFLSTAVSSVTNHHSGILSDLEARWVRRPGLAEGNLIRDH